MNFFDHKDLGNHLLQLCPKVVKHPVYVKKQQVIHSYREQILCFVDHASVYNLFQMKPTRCTLLLSIFISPSLHVSGNYVPIIRRTYCIYMTLVFFILYGGLSGLLVGMRSHPNQRSRQPPTQNKKYQCRIDTVSSPDDGHIVARNM